MGNTHAVETDSMAAIAADVDAEHDQGKRAAFVDEMVVINEILAIRI